MSERPLRRWYFTVPLRSTHFGYVTARSRADAIAVASHDREPENGEALEGVDTEVDWHGAPRLIGAATPTPTTGEPER